MIIIVSTNTSIPLAAWSICRQLYLQLTLIMKSPLISSKKVTLSSEYGYFDLLPMKKYQECNMRIPETVLLEKGFVRDWVFNSHKIPNHPILKKKKQNLTPLSVIRTFCNKNGYGQAIQGYTTARDISNVIKQALKQQKDYDFIKDKKFIEITTVSNEILVMTLVDFLDLAAESKYSEQSFYDKWKMIQEKVSFTKIDEYYKVDNVRNNHIIQSKCQKIISVNTTEAAIHSTEIDDDPYKNNSPNKNYTMAETKNLEGYKFFDTFLNKKFFQMSAQLIEFIEKNLKCIVESVVTKFVINKEREPYLASISDLEIKPAKKIADMKEFQSAREKGYVKIEQYCRCLDVYIQQNMDKLENYNIHTPIGERRKKCKGKFCKMPLQQVYLPAVVQYKLKLPTISANSRIVSFELRDAVIKRKRRVIQKLIQNKVLNNDYQIEEESSEYETEGDEEESGRKFRNANLKVCENCFTFYFHINRLFDLDIYGNLVQKKLTTQTIVVNEQHTEDSQIKGLTFLSKDEIKRERSNKKGEDPNKNVQNLSNAFVNKKLESEQKAAYQASLIKPITVEQSPDRKQTNLLRQSKSNPKALTPIKKQKNQSLSKTENQIKSDKKLPAANSKSKIKLDPLNAKNSIAQQSMANNPTNTKGHRLLTLTKLSQPSKLHERDSKSKTMHPNMIAVKQRRPENHAQAMEQLIKKLALLPDSSKQQLIHFAKKYYKDNLPQQVDRRSYSTYYEPHLYQFMSTSPVTIHPKRRIKRRPDMSLKRLSELTDYPQIVSRSQFVFDTLIVNEQTTIPFCILTTKVVNPDALRTGVPFENIIIVNDIFDSFIQHISMSKQILEEDEVYNKRIILFDYPGQSHTIYNRSNTQSYSAYFCQVLDKLIYHLSSEAKQLKIVDLDKDQFKFCGFGYGAYLLASYLGAYSITFEGKLGGVMLVNPFMQYPKRYVQILQSLLQLYRSNDPTVQSQSHLYYNKAINSEETDPEQLEHKSGLNPIRIQDRIYLLNSILFQHNNSVSTSGSSIYPEYFQEVTGCQVSIIYGRSNAVIDKNSASEFTRYMKDRKREIQNRVFIEIDGGHDILADNYEDIFRVITLFARK